MFSGKMCQTCLFVVFKRFTSLLAIVGFTPAIVDDSAAEFCYGHFYSHFFLILYHSGIDMAIVSSMLLKIFIGYTLSTFKRETYTTGSRCGMTGIAKFAQQRSKHNMMT